jgi:hypothetical protein
MKFITRITILGFIMFLTSMNVHAQTKQQVKKAHKEAENLQFFLELDDEITEGIYKIYLITLGKIQKLNQSSREGAITEIERKKQHRLLLKQNQNEIEKILTPKKVKKYRIHRKKVREAKENY